jgi:SNF2 family DNA or RNA helicase
MNIDGNTYIIYDKYSGDHSFNNTYTSGVNLETLLKSDTITIEGENALKEYNSYASNNHKIKEKLDLNFYKLIMFKLKVKDHDVSVLVVGINHELLNKYYPNIPNKDFLIYSCTCHISYNKNVTYQNKQDLNDRKHNLTVLASGCNTDITDMIIENPNFTKINLFDYQRRTVKWMFDKETTKQVVSYSFNDEVYFGEYVCDAIKKDIISTKNRKSIQFIGGLLADEVGLGKTFQTISLSLLNPPTVLSYFQQNSKRLHSRATLIICPNQLCNQWIREISKTIKDDYKVVAIPMMTKVHYDKYTYTEILDADFVIVSYNFLGNDAYYKPWLKTDVKPATYLRNKDNVDNINIMLDEMYDKIKAEPIKLFETNPVLNCIKFHRIVCDEFHEIYTVDKYNYLRTIIQLFTGNNKWCVTGTPFNKGDCVEKMLEFVSDYKINDPSKLMMNDTIYDYISKQFFRRNTKQSIKAEYKLIPYDEKIILMKLSPTERAIYSAYLANPNVSRFSVLVRQLCNDPRLADEIKTNISTCKTPEDIEKMMVKHYKSTADDALEKLEIIKYRYKKLLRKITVVEYKRCRRFLKSKDTSVKIEYPPKIYDPKYEKKLEDDDNNLDDSEDEDEDEDEDDKKKLVVINNTTYSTLFKKVEYQLNKNPSITLENLNKISEEYKLKIDKADREYQGKKGTCEFFSNMLNKLNKLKSGEELDEEDKDNCPICLNEITGDDVGVTKCGHLFCYECIKQNIVKQPKCPTCMKPSNASDIYMISYEKPKPVDTKEQKDKAALVSKIGTKLANLVLFLKSSNGKSILFSQWDDMLRRTGEVLTSHGIKNVYCRGNVWSRDKAIRDFTFQEDVKVIMLSSESAAAGTNLTAAENVILLDAIYKDDSTHVNGMGSYEYRRNMEWQAIGRAYRMGQTKKVNVIRFIMKDTVEEEIYKINKEEDKKFKDNVDLIDKMIEMDDEKINATSDDIEKMTKAAEQYKANKPVKKPVKKLVGRAAQQIVDDSDLSDSDLSDDD